MTKNHFISGIALMTLLSAFNPQVSTFAQGTAFTYQGRLNDGGNPATGIYDLRFTIYDALSGGAVVSGPLTNSATGVTNGLFRVALDFGSSPFSSGAARWLNIDVQTNGGGGFATLSPRQSLTPTPYAIYAGAAGGVNGLTIQNNATSPNLIGGYSGNTVSGGVVGGVIGGGGTAGFVNQVQGN